MKRVFALLLCVGGIFKSGEAQLSLAPLAFQTISSVHPLSLSALNLPKVNQLQVPIMGNGTNRVDDVCITGCAIILPLSSLELQGLRINDYQVALNWKTKNEKDSRGFDVERSLGDPLHFMVVGALPSNISNAVEKKYALTDPNTFSGLSYYRVKQIDMDGHFNYSNTVQVKGYNTKESVWITPNPASALSVLYCFTATKGDYLIRVLSANGQTVYTQKWALTVGSNSTKLPVQNFASGMYYVQLVWPDGHHQDLKLAVE